MGAGFVCKAKGAKQGEILIYEDVGEGFFGGVTAKQFSQELAALGDVTALDVRINSYGGDVFDGLAIYNTLVRHPATVTTHIDGIAASIASVIAMAGTDIRIAESGWLMIHDAWGMAIGNAADMRSMADRLEATSGSIANIYAARTGSAEAQLRAWMAEEKWFDAAAAVEHGWANSVAENLRMAARALPERFAFRHAPDALRAIGARQSLLSKAEDDAVRVAHQQATERVRRAASVRRTTRSGAT